MMEPSFIHPISRVQSGIDRTLAGIKVLRADESIPRGLIEKAEAIVAGLREHAERPRRVADAFWEYATDYPGSDFVKAIRKIRERADVARAFWSYAAEPRHVQLAGRGTRQLPFQEKLKITATSTYATPTGADSQGLFSLEFENPVDLSDATVVWVPTRNRDDGTTFVAAAPAVSGPWPPPRVRWWSFRWLNPSLASPPIPGTAVVIRPHRPPSFSEDFLL